MEKLLSSAVPPTQPLISESPLPGKKHLQVHIASAIHSRPFLPTPSATTPGLSLPHHRTGIARFGAVPSVEPLPESIESLKYGAPSKMSKASPNVAEPDEHMHSRTSCYVILSKNLKRTTFSQKICPSNIYISCVLTTFTCRVHRQKCISIKTNISIEYLSHTNHHIMSCHPTGSHGSKDGDNAGNNCSTNSIPPTTSKGPQGPHCRPQNWGLLCFPQEVYVGHSRGSRTPPLGPRSGVLNGVPDHM